MFNNVKNIIRCRIHQNNSKNSPGIVEDLKRGPHGGHRIQKQDPAYSDSWRDPEQSWTILNNPEQSWSWSQFNVLSYRWAVWRDPATRTFDYRDDCWTLNWKHLAEPSRVDSPLWCRGRASSSSIRTCNDVNISLINFSTLPNLL